MLASLALPVRCPDTLAAGGVTAAAEWAEVAAAAGTAAAQTRATPAARPAATAARPNRDLRLAGAGWSSRDLFSDVMTTPLLIAEGDVLCAIRCSDVKEEVLAIQIQLPEIKFWSIGGRLEFTRTRNRQTG